MNQQKLEINEESQLIVLNKKKLSQIFPKKNSKQISKLISKWYKMANTFENTKQLDQWSAENKHLSFWGRKNQKDGFISAVQELKHQKISIFFSSYTQRYFLSQQQYDPWLYFRQEQAKWKRKQKERKHSYQLQKISHINFSNLTTLRIKNGHLKNIQALTLIKMPNIQFISMTDNQIFSMKSLGKLNFPNLTKFDLNSGLIWANSILTETHMMNRCKTSRQWKSIYKHKQLYDYSWYCTWQFDYRIVVKNQWQTIQGAFEDQQIMIFYRYSRLQNKQIQANLSVLNRKFMNKIKSSSQIKFN